MELAVIKPLLSKLGSLLADEYSLIRGVRGDIQFINDELASMQAFLSNLGDSSTDGHDDQTEDWMKQVRDVSYDIEDCIDDFAHGLNPDPRGNDWLTKIRMTLYELRTSCRRRSIAAQVAVLKERAKHVGDRRVRYGVPDPEPGKKRNIFAGYNAAEHQEATRRLIGINKPVGVKDMPELEKWITSDDNKKLGVLSIFGFGGVGKTTAAMSLYQNCGVEFKHRAVVIVSHNMDPDVVLSDILRQVSPQGKDHQGHDSTGSISAKKQAALVPQCMLNFFQKSVSKLSQTRLLCGNQEEDGIASNKEHARIKGELHKHLGNNRYLLLIDDVWSSSTWQTILNCLPANEYGSRIIVSTRFEAVASTSHVDHHKFHKMEVLSEKDANDLFDKSLLECMGAGGSQPRQNNQVPKRLWEMCGGLPLPIVTMAGLVASKPQTDHKEWINVCETLFPEPQVCHKPEEFMRIVNYCYIVLPSDLKTCSLYLCIFPKAGKISRKRLIRRWISEGFISEKQGLSVEDVAETCFNQLIERNIIRPVEHSSNGKVKSCQVHDMVLEYIMSKAGEEDFVTVVGGYWSMATRRNKVRRLSLHNSDSKHAKKADNLNLSHVRSLTVFGSLDQVRFNSLKTRIVQVLDLEGCTGFKANHVSVSDICEMTLLKYLSLRGTDLSKLPSKIGNLKYLETLDIRETEIQELPKTVGQLEQISNILGGNKRTRKALKVPKAMKGATKTLRILSGIEIGEGSIAASDLSYFTGLKKLGIYKLQRSDQVFKDLLSSIQYLSGYYLQALVIDDESSDFLNTLDSMSSRPTDLTALELSGKLLKLPKWIPFLNKLVKLTLSATALCTDNLVVLSKLGSLFSLTFSTRPASQDPDFAAIVEQNKSDSGGEIFIPAGGFGKLKLVRIFVPLVPALNFSKKATTQLERLELRFKRFEGVRGIEKLESLHDVLITVDDKAGEPTKSILEELKKRSSGKYALIINEY